MSNQPKSTAFYHGGALMADRQIKGLTNGPMNDDSAGYYGGRWMICETLSESAARAIAAALGMTWSDAPTTDKDAK